MSRSSKPLKSGHDCPATWSQLNDWFHDGESCSKYLEKLRWSQGFNCPRCSEVEEPYLISRGRFMCRVCRYQCTVTAGTLFEKCEPPSVIGFQLHGISPAK